MYQIRSQSSQSGKYFWSSFCGKDKSSFNAWLSENPLSFNGLVFVQASNTALWWGKWSSFWYRGFFPYKCLVSVSHPAIDLTFCHRGAAGVKRRGLTPGGCSWDNWAIWRSQCANGVLIVLSGASTPFHLSFMNVRVESTSSILYVYLLADSWLDISVPTWLVVATVVLLIF